jgi:hypothetical protein
MSEQLAEKSTAVILVGEKDVKQLHARWKAWQDADGWDNVEWDDLFYEMDALFKTYGLRA